MVPLAGDIDVAVAGIAFKAATPAFKPASEMFSARFVCRSRPNACSFAVTAVIVAAVAIVRTLMTITERMRAMPSSGAQ